MKRQFLFVSAVLAAVLGCNSRPSVSEAESAVAAQLDGGETSRVRLVDFRKIEGQAGEVMGVQVYSMDFTATVQFAEDAWYTTGGSIMQPEVHINTRPIGEVPK